MAQTAADVEYAHARGQTRGLQNQTRGTLDDRGLTIESSQLLRVVAKHVLLRRSQFTFHHRKTLSSILA